MSETKPHRPSPGRLSVAAGQLVLALWLVLMTIADFAGPGITGVLGRAVAPVGIALVGVFGFVLPVIFGMFPRLGPGLLALRRPTRRATLAPEAAGVSMAAMAVAWLATGEPAVVSAMGAAAAFGGLSLAAMVAFSRAPLTGDVKLKPSGARAHLTAPGNLMLGAGLVYLVAGGALFVVAGLQPLREAAGGPASLAAPLHLITAGFIALAVFGIGLRMFSAFAGAEAPAWAAWAVALSGAAAPAGVAYALWSSPPQFATLALFGGLGLVASSCFAGTVLYLREHQRRPRQAWWLLSVGACLLVVGELLGALFGMDPSLIAFAAVHGQVNVLGFAGLTIFGVLFELSGSDAARPGVRSWGLAIVVAWPLGLLVKFAAVALDAPWMAAMGSLAILAGYVVAARDAHPRAR